MKGKRREIKKITRWVSIFLLVGSLIGGAYEIKGLREAQRRSDERWADFEKNKYLPDWRVMELIRFARTDTEYEIKKTPPVTMPVKEVVALILKHLKLKVEHTPPESIAERCRLVPKKEVKK